MPLINGKKSNMELSLGHPLNQQLPNLNKLILDY